MAVATPTVQEDEVLVGLARMFLCPFVMGSTTALPANTVQLNGEWATPWTTMGATEEGLTVAFTRETNDITIEESIIPVDVVTESAEFNANVVLMQDSIKTMKLAYGGGLITVTPAGTNTPAVQSLRISSALDKLTFGAEGINQYGYWRRVRIPKCVSIADAETQYRKSEARKYEVSLRGICPVEQVDIIEMTAPQTGP